MSRVARRWVIAAVVFWSAALLSCGRSRDAQIRITFHDTQIDGRTIARVDMTVVETQLLDFYDRKIVVSNQPQSFDLLEVTANNPVLLAYARVPAGMYKQIRLVLAPGTTITLADGTTQPLKTPSGEEGGIKIDGVFEIPAGRLYTLDIDMDPGRSIHYAAGTGYVLKPVLTITGSEPNSGNFFFAGSYGGDPFVVALRPDGTLATISARYPQYVIVGYYVHDGVQQTLTIVPQTVTCPDCSTWQRLETSIFADVPPAQTFDVVSFGADFFDLRDASGALFHLYRVPTFALDGDYSQKAFTVQATIQDTSWVGKTLVAQIVPQDGDGAVHTDVVTIPASLNPSFDFRIPRTAFRDSVKNYVLLMAVVPTPADVALRSDETISEIHNVVAENSQAAVQLRVQRDTVPTGPVVVPFATQVPTTH